MKKSVVTLASLLLANSASFAAINYDFKKDTGEVRFQATGYPKLVPINGHGKGVLGNLTQDDQKISGNLSFELGTLDTELGMRNTHMKEKYLQIEKFPTAKISDIDIKLPDGWMKTTKEAKAVPFSGQLELHGEKKQVKGTANITSEDGKVKVKAEFPVKLTDYKIDIPSFMGVTVAEDVAVTVETAAAVEVK